MPVYPRGVLMPPRSLAPPPEPPVGQGPSQGEAPVVKGKGYAVEMFGGSARLSRAYAGGDLMLMV